MQIKKENVLLLGSEGLLGKSFQLFLKDKENLNTICVDIKKKKISTNYIQANIKNPKSIIKVINFFEKRFNKIDHIIDCVYPILNLKRNKRINKYDLKTLEKNLSKNMSYPIMLCEIFGEYFKKNKIKGNFIFISSIQGIMAPKFDHYKGSSMSSPAEYTAIKFGLSGIVKYFAKYYGKHKINFNCISPGGILNNQSPSFLKKYKKDCLSQGMLNPEDLYSTLYLLLQKNSKMINGQNIIVDDGWSL